MEDEIKFQAQVFQPSKPSADGTVINEEAFKEAVEKYFSDSKKIRYMYLNNKETFGRVSHNITDICGTVDKPMFAEDGSVSFEGTILPQFPSGKVVKIELGGLINAKNENAIAENFQNYHFEPNGWIDPQTKELVLSHFSLVKDNPMENTK